jgi:hypothetical protein
MVRRRLSSSTQPQVIFGSSNSFQGSQTQYKFIFRYDLQGNDGQCSGKRYWFTECNEPTNNSWSSTTGWKMIKQSGKWNKDMISKDYMAYLDEIIKVSLFSTWSLAVQSGYVDRFFPLFFNKKLKNILTGLVTC